MAAILPCGQTCTMIVINVITCTNASRSALAVCDDWNEPREVQCAYKKLSHCVKTDPKASCTDPTGITLWLRAVWCVTVKIYI
jgi:hypothetical protein